MKELKNKNIILGLVIVVLLSAIVTILTMNNENVTDLKVINNINAEDAIIPQKIIKELDTEQKVYAIYYKDKLLGILKDYDKLQALLDYTYEKDYKKDYPNNKIGLGEDIHLKTQYLLVEYEDKDKEILEYITKKDLFSIEANKITFSNGAVAYVKNAEDFTLAREEYVLNYISKESYDLFKSNGSYPELSTYGRIDISYSFLEEAKISKALVSEKLILKDKKECLQYLGYGYSPTRSTYAVQAFDTIPGIAWLNQITVQHLMNNNTDLIKQENQIIEPGTILDTTKLQSPIQVQVIRESLAREVVYPQPTQYIYDSTMVEGRSDVVQSEALGYKNVKYEETYINGTLTGATAQSERIIQAPQREIIRVGTRVIPNIGSGNFRSPVDNSLLTCGWGCYYGHMAADLQNAYNNYGAVYASDRGTVISNKYDSIGGYQMVIDHNNGYQTYYGHMSVPGFIQVGSTVYKGEVIGKIGRTGVATGPHVHFEIRYNGVRQNPCRYIAC